MVTVPFVTTEAFKKKLHVNLQQFNIHGIKKHYEYHYIMIVAFFDKGGACLGHDMKPSELMISTVSVPKVSFVFNKPAKGKYYVLCLHLQLRINDEPSTLLASNGMRIITVKEL